MTNTVEFVRDEAKQAAFFAEVKKNGFGFLCFGNRLLIAELATEKQYEYRSRSHNRLHKISRITQLGGFSGLLESPREGGRAFFVLNPEDRSVMIRFKYAKEHTVKDVLESDKSGAIESAASDLGYKVFKGKFFKVGE